MTLNYDQSYFIGFILEAVLWGAYTIIFGLALYYSGVRSELRPVNGVLFGAMIALYMMSTTHFSLVFRNVYQGLMVHFYPIGVEDNILEGADLINFTTDFIGQLVLAYRCWFMWGERWSVVALPLLMSCTSYIFAIVGMAEYIRVDHGLPAGVATSKLMTAAFDIALGVPVGTDLLLTLLIIGRIWYLSRWTPELLSSRRVQAAITIIAESGAMVIIVQLISSVLFFRNMASQNISLSILAQIYGIAPTIIILRIGMGTSVDATLNATLHNARGTDTENAIDIDKQEASHGSSSGSRTAFTNVDAKMV